MNSRPRISPPTAGLLASFWSAANRGCRSDERAAYHAWRGRLRDVSERLTEQTRIFGPRSPAAEHRLGTLATELAQLVAETPLMRG